MSGRGFEAFGEALMVTGSHRASICSLGMVGPSYSVVRRDRGHCFELALIASFYCPDGSLFIQRNDPNDGLTLTLLARDGNRRRFPPVVFPFPKAFFIYDVEAQLKVQVTFQTSTSHHKIWQKHYDSVMRAHAQTLTQHITQHRNQLEAQRQQQRQQRARHQAAQRDQFVDHHLVNPMQNLNLGL